MKNEWHLIIEVLKSVKTGSEVSFAVVESKSSPEESFVGILMDKKGREYEILLDESENLELALLGVHELKQVEDFETKTITFQKTEVMEKTPGTQYNLW